MGLSPPTDLNEIIVFARVVQRGSFVAAGRVLAMPKSTVSRKVSALEERLGTRLLHRTTRKLSLTDEGRAYFQHAARILAELEAADAAITERLEAPRGLLRVTTPLNLGRLGATVAEFMGRCPEVRLEIVCTDRVVDLVAEGFDVGIRAGALQDSSLVARTLGTIRNIVVASPALLAERGEPTRPSDLSRWPCAALTGHTSWTLQRGAKTTSVKLDTHIVVNDFDVLAGAALGGVAVALLPALQHADALRTGALRRVLPQWCSPPVPIQLVYPSVRHVVPKVKAFVDHLLDARDSPLWDPADAHSGSGPLPSRITST